MFNNVDPKIGGFFLVTGFSFAAFASGFSVCLFDMSTVDQCVDVSNLWLDRFIQGGGHVLEWFFAVFHAALVKQA